MYLSDDSLQKNIIDESVVSKDAPSSGSTTVSDSSTPSDSSTEEALSMLSLEMSEVGPEGIMPFAPMMTFQKFLTMQVCVEQ